MRAGWCLCTNDFSNNLDCCSSCWRSSEELETLKIPQGCFLFVFLLPEAHIQRIDTRNLGNSAKKKEKNGGRMIDSVNMNKASKDTTSRDFWAALPWQAQPRQSFVSFTSHCRDTSLCFTQTLIVDTAVDYFICILTFTLMLHVVDVVSAGFLETFLFGISTMFQRIHTQSKKTHWTNR